MRATWTQLGLLVGALCPGDAAAGAAAAGRASKLFIPTVLSSDMVLPADNSTIWGSASAGASISLTLAQGGHTATHTAVADAKGNWAIPLAVGASMDPANITISGDGGSKTLERVLFGLLVFCSGQSNMEITIDAFEGYSPRPGNNVTAIKTNSSLFADRVRIMTVAGAGKANPGPPDADVKSAADYVWAVPSPETLGGHDKYFSAECWATGSALADLRPGVPIGLLSAAMGGSMIQSWMSPEAMAACPSAKLRHPPAFGAQGQWWNGMVAPLLPLRPSAVVWVRALAPSCPSLPPFRL